MKINGKLIISLDFELLWGMRDHETVDSYGKNIKGVRDSLPLVLELFETYCIKATFATVGFLFSSNKKELESFIPKVKPQYNDKNLSPYNGYLNNVKNSEDEDEYHFANNLIELIRKYSGHEIATHTFSHYYCLEEGQILEEFRVDLETAIKIAKIKNIEIKSIIFPRNQINSEYLKVCYDLGIKSYRGNENVWFYEEESRSKSRLHKRLFRILDTYFNISGYNCYSQMDYVDGKLLNIPASRFLRPYSRKLRALENIRINRILDSMTHAAKTGKIYHLWWHPHNFGKYTAANIEVLIRILEHYRELHFKYNFESMTMETLSQESESTMD